VRPVSANSCIFIVAVSCQFCCMCSTVGKQRIGGGDRSLLHFEIDHIRLTATRLERTNGVKWRDERTVCRVICCSDKLFGNPLRPTVSVSLQEFFLFSVLELYLYTGLV